MMVYLREARHPFNPSKTIILRCNNPDGSYCGGSFPDMNTAIRTLTAEGIDFTIIPTKEDQNGNLHANPTR